MQPHFIGPRAGNHRPSHPRLRKPRHLGRVLVAEDDGEMRQLLAEQLRAEGYAVEVLADGGELAARLARSVREGDRERPDLVVSDVRMPGWSGMQVLRALRRSDWGTPVVLITAFGDTRLHEDAHRLGAAIVLDKPFELDDLVHAVRAIVPPRV